MYSDNKQIRDVANIAAQIMSGQQPVTEELKNFIRINNSWMCMSQRKMN
jgi:hypothetical protein